MQNKKNMFTVKGFQFSGTHCGIKKNGKNDIGIVFSDTPAISAGVFTKNKVKAAPVRLDIEHIKNRKTSAIIVNSGNANACTGKKGEEDALEMVNHTASCLKIEPASVLVASTGVIGQPLPMKNIKKGIIDSCKQLSENNLNDFSDAILTTDIFSKIAFKKIKIGSATTEILGVAKGAGMICPNMATMLCFVVTDINITKNMLNKALKDAVNNSFNLITVDGDMSTNDSVIILANGKANNIKITKNDSDYIKFTKALTDILKELAFKIVKDGEGASKFIAVNVKNAGSKKDAKNIGLSVANSKLVKTAFFGEDPNWGRIICAVGYSKAEIDPDKIDIYFDKIKVVSGGKAQDRLNYNKLNKVLKNKEISVTIDVKQGEYSETIYTSDLNYEYIKINSSYTS